MRGSRQSHAGALRCHLCSTRLLLVTRSCSRLPGPHAAVSLTLTLLAALLLARSDKSVRPRLSLCLWAKAWPSLGKLNIKQS